MASAFAGDFASGEETIAGRWPPRVEFAFVETDEFFSLGVPVGGAL